MYYTSIMHEAEEETVSPLKIRGRSEPRKENGNDKH